MDGHHERQVAGTDRPLDHLSRLGLNGPNPHGQLFWESCDETECHIMAQHGFGPFVLHYNETTKRHELWQLTSVAADF
jgi:hypothetical protein